MRWRPRPRRTEKLGCRVSSVGETGGAIGLVERNSLSNLRPSDYQKPLPDSAGYDGTLRVIRVDVSGWCVLVLDVGGRSG